MSNMKSSARNNLQFPTNLVGGGYPEYNAALSEKAKLFGLDVGAGSGRPVCLFEPADVVVPNPPVESSWWQKFKTYLSRGFAVVSLISSHVARRGDLLLRFPAVRRKAFGNYEYTGAAGFQKALRNRSPHRLLTPTSLFKTRFFLCKLYHKISIVVKFPPGGNCNKIPLHRRGGRRRRTGWLSRSCTTYDKLFCFIRNVISNSQNHPVWRRPPSRFALRRTSCRQTPLRWRGILLQSKFCGIKTCCAGLLRWPVAPERSKG